MKQKFLFVKKIKKEDGLVDFLDAKRLILKYKAYSYWPGIFLSSELKLKDIELNEEISINNPGEILEIKKDYILVACEKGSLKIKTLQAPSKKAISSVDFVRGQRLEVGNIII